MKLFRKRRDPAETLSAAGEPEAVGGAAALTPAGKMMFALARRDYPGFQQWRLENDREEARRLEVPLFVNDLLKRQAGLRFPEGHDPAAVVEFARRERPLIANGWTPEAEVTEILVNEALGGLAARDLLADHTSQRVAFHRLQLVADLGDDLALSTDELNAVLIAVERKAAHRRGDTYPVLWGRPAEPVLPRPEGPRDSGEVAEPRTGRIDFGALLVGRTDGFALGMAETDDGELAEVTVRKGGLELRLQAFTADVQGDTWQNLRGEAKVGYLVEQGALLEEVPSRFGTELWIQWPITTNGKTKVNFIRTLGYDGPGWMVKATIAGDDAFDAAATEPFERLYEDVVVVRGEEPLAPRKLIPLRLPAS